MKKQIIGLSLLAGLLLVSPVQQGMAAAVNVSSITKVDKQINKLVSKMTLEEKAAFLCGTGMPGFDGIKPIVGFVDNGRVPGAAGATYAIPRLKIPQIVVSDGPAGLRISPTRKNDQNTYYATAFPVGTLLASTWNTALVNEVGKAMGNEVKEYGVDVILGPGMNIHRNPLCGRNFEYYSEDPVITGMTAAAMINGIQSNGVGTSAKHFAANNQETNRQSIDETISERAMREIYLHGFELAVKLAQPWTIMTSYNLIDGTYTSERKDLLTNILRNEWGFKGLVMTDWFGGYGGFESLSGASDVVKQISAGNDLLMPGVKPQINMIISAVKDGSLSINDVDISVKRLLELIYKSQTFANYKYSNKPALKHNAEVTREAASEGMVLLKDADNTLPLSPSAGIVATFGATSYNFISGGTGSGDVNEAYTISLIQGLTNAGYQLDQQLINLYVPFVKSEVERISHRGTLDAPLKMKELEMNNSLIEQKAQDDAVAIITIGRNAGEGHDRNVEADFNLDESEQEMIIRVADAFHAQGKKVIVILNIGGVVETSSWKNKVDAILLSWQPGQEGGNSVADVLTGKVNPSGKLTMTFPVNYYDTPSAKNWLGTPKADPKHVTYQEGIYVGYRYFDTFGVKPSYEFGYGLSYTTFDYSNLTLSSNIFTNKLTATVTITNTGKVAGKEVAELYLSAPKGSIDKPIKELKAYAKTNLLQPGESQTLTLNVNPRDLSSFHENEEAWIADKGQYQVQIGASSEDIRQTATFSLPETKIVEKVHPAFKVDQAFTELKAK
jgi:beta-glucosidase